MPFPSILLIALLCWTGLFTSALAADPELPGLGIRSWHALLIGVQEYQDPRVNDLETPERDVTDLGRLLCLRYGFSEVRLLTSEGEARVLREAGAGCRVEPVEGGRKATRGGVLSSLRELRGSVTAQDALLIYFAGHGILDDQARQGYWLPSNAASDNPDNWISNGDVRDQIGALDARHVLLIADACYSGSLLTRDVRPPTPSVDLLAARRLASRRSRVVITSGGREPVVDKDARSDHSVFAHHLLSVLGEQEAPFISPEDFFPTLRSRVIANAEQTPEMAPLKMAGDEGGQFLMLNHQASGAPTPGNSRPVSGGATTGSTENIARLAACAAELQKQEKILRSGAASDWDRVRPLLARKDESTRKVVQSWLDKWGPGKVQAAACDEQRALLLDESTQALDWLRSLPATGTESAGSGSPQSTPLRFGYNIIKLKPGLFSMGSPASESSRKRDELQHPVQVSQAFDVLDREVSQALWFEIMGDRPWCESYQDQGLVGEELPVQCVTWLDAIRFCNQLSERDGLEPAYSLRGQDVWWKKESAGWRLLTEAEWEYAARAGTSTVYTGSSSPTQACRHANIADARARVIWTTWQTFDCDDAYTGPSPVGTFPPNALGLHDMTGNVAEWVWDFYGDYPPGAVRDPAGPLTGAQHIVRGGSWGATPAFARIAARLSLDPGRRDPFVGLRVGRRTSPQPGAPQPGAPP